MEAGEDCRVDIGVVEEGAMEGGEEEQQIGCVGARDVLRKQMNCGLHADSQNALREIDFENQKTN